MSKSNYREYLVDEELFRKIKARYHGEVFNRKEGDKYRISITKERAKYVEKLFKVKLQKAPKK